MEIYRVLWEPDIHERHESWNLLWLLNTRENLPWLCASDFNEILRSSKKECGSSWSQAQMQIYREAIDKCGFVDLGFTGSQFTWQKHFVAGHSVWEMLDHGFVTNDWLLQFVESKVHHLSCNTSDHSPLWMVPRNWNLFVSLNHSTLKKCGSFDRRCTKTVEAVWSSVDYDGLAIRIVHKIEKCSKALSSWN